MFTDFTMNAFTLEAQASFVYNGQTRSGIVKEVKPTHIKLETIDPNTQAVVTKTYNYHKMQKLG
jgi:hypothetical protein